jgi:hypothetical protein
MNPETLPAFDGWCGTENLRNGFEIYNTVFSRFNSRASHVAWNPSSW